MKILVLENSKEIAKKFIYGVKYYVLIAWYTIGISIILKKVI